MQWPTFTDHAARIVILVSLYGALALAALLLFLVMRRDRKERGLMRAQDTARALIRELMGTVAGKGTPGPVYAAARPEQRLAAISHLNQLVRGEDRERLIRFVDEYGLLERFTHQARKRRASRRVDAVRTLGGIGGATAIAVLRDVMRTDRQPLVKLEAAAMLARNDALPPPDVLITDLDLEQMPITPMHRALFRSVARERREEIARLVHRRLPSPVRALLVDALGYAQDYGVLETLAVAAEDDDPEVRLAALRSARRVGHPAAAAWVVPMLDDVHDDVRGQAVRTCTSLRLRSASGRIAVLITDGSPWVRLYARQAAETLGGATT